MKSLYLIFTFTLIFYTSLIEAQGITVIPSAPPEAQVVSTNNLYQWQGFQDVEILPGHDNKAYVLFAIRHGRGPVWGYPQNTVGLWYGYIDRNVRWYSGGVKKELRDHLHASHNLYLQGLSNATANVITACQDHEKQYHIFIGLSDASDANHPTRLVYLKWAHEHIVTTKVSNILADNIRPRMQCIADPMNNIHIFGLPQWYRNETQDSKIAAYKITPVEQNSPDKFLHLTPTMLPDTFKTGLFTIYPSHRGFDLAYANRNSLNLSLATKPYEQRSIANVTSGWRILFNDNARPDGNQSTALSHMAGFSVRNRNLAHLIAQKKNNGGIVHYYQNNRGHWKTDGRVLNAPQLGTMSVAGVEDRPIFSVVGTTNNIGNIWFGYYNFREARWIDKGIIFNQRSH